MSVHATSRARLLTAHGTLLCHAPGRGLVQRPLAAPPTDAIPIELFPVSDAAGQYRRFLEAPHETGAPIPVPIPPTLAGLAPVAGEGLGTLAFSDGEKFLCASGHNDRVTTDRDRIGNWESFLPLAPADERLLRGLFEADWLLASTGRLVERTRIRLGFPFRLELDGQGFDLRHALPFEGRPLPFRIALFRNGWRLDELCLHRPLVHLTGFGPVRGARLDAVLRSLLERGRYDGQILVVTDRTRDDLLRRVPALDPARLTVRTQEAPTPAEAFAARYALTDWPECFRHQPILMADTTALFDAPVAPLLHRLAASDRIAAGPEPHARRRQAPFVGLSLLQRESRDLRDLIGLDASTIGVPNLATHAHPLRLVARLVRNRAAASPNGAAPWLEQEVLNYVSARTLPFDPHLLASRECACLRPFGDRAETAAEMTAWLRETRPGEPPSPVRPTAPPDPADEPIGPP